MKEPDLLSEILHTDKTFVKVVYVMLILALIAMACVAYIDIKTEPDIYELLN